MDEKKQYRKSPRANWIAYNVGNYFVTVCTKNHIHYFGHIQSEKMVLSPIGEYLNDALRHTTDHFPYIEVPLFVVMPNHFHAVVVIREPKTPKAMPTILGRMNSPLPRTQLPLLSNFMASLKSSVTRYARKNNIDFAWQPRYHDHMIRNNYERNTIADYILTNISKWTKDKYYS